MALSEEIAELIEACRQNPPPNEAATCEWVILQVLRSVGYRAFEIVPQMSNVAGKYPDYTILPNTAHTWYLEAKEWKRDLQNDQDLIQALNYAHTTGHRWVVLSNGREWRLYDDHISGVEPGKRLVAAASTDSPKLFVEFINAISRDSVTSGRLEDYTVAYRLKSALEIGFSSSDSYVIRSIFNCLRKTGIPVTRPADVVTAIQELLQQPALAMPQSDQRSDTEPPTELHGEMFTLRQLRKLGKNTWHSKPEEVVLPDSSRVALRRWADVAFEVVKWLADHGKMPQLPFRGCRGGKRWFLNTTPFHEDGIPMRAYRVYNTNGAPIYMCTNRSSSAFTKCLDSLCGEAGVSTSDVSVKLRNPVA